MIEAAAKAAQANPNQEPGDPGTGTLRMNPTDLELLEAAAKLGRKLERLDADKADAHREWTERLDQRFAKKRANLLDGAAPTVIAKLGLFRKETH